MIITHIGHSCFKIQGGKAILITDPFDSSIGLKMPKIQADIVTVSHDHYDHANTQRIVGVSEQEEPFVIKGPGEYEIKEVVILGIGSFHDNQKGKVRGTNTIYLIEIDGLKLVHLGDLGHLLEEEHLEKLGEVDVLFIPVGGGFTLDYRKAVEVVEQVEPKIVIPMHYKTPDLNLDIDKIDKFLREIGIKEERMTRLKISKRDLPEERKLIILENV